MVDAVKDLIARLEAAAEGSRELDADIFEVAGGELYKRARVLAAEPCGAPDDTVAKAARGYAPRYTTSIDAALPGEDIVFMRKVEDGQGRVWYEAQQSGSFGYTGKHKSEAIARRIAALKARQP
jgi:hypothetical protein